MRIVLQRVSSASVHVDGRLVAQIGAGMLLLVGVGRDDRPEEVQRLAEKVYHLRIFEDPRGKMNLDLSDIGGEMLVVPQFTLYGDWRKGRRPSWVNAATSEVASERMASLADALEDLGVRVARGAFREHMQVELVNDGPVTLVLDGADL